MGGGVLGEPERGAVSVEQLAEIFPGPSAMAGIMRAKKWADTPLGPAEDWPDALKIPLRMLLTSRFEMWLGWGPDLHFFYNDAYIPTLGIKHPQALGRPFREVWSEVYDDVADQVERVRSGEATWNKALLLILERSGYPEETYHSFSYSPLFQSDGTIGGLLCVVTEETARVISERRLETLRHLGSLLVNVTDRAGIQDAVRSTFAANRKDFPFVALHLAGDDVPDDNMALFQSAEPRFGGAFNLAGNVIALPAHVDWPQGDWDRPPSKAIAVAVPAPGSESVAGSLVLALNPYREPDEDVLAIARLIGGQIGSALANVVALGNERRRADRLWSVSRDLMVVIDPSGVFRSISPSWTRILGHPLDTVVGQHFSAFMHPEDIAGAGSALNQALEDRDLTSYENRLMTADGGFRRIEWHTTMEDGLVYGYGRDVTERRMVEEALTESREQFRRLVQGVTDYAIQMLDLEGNVSSWNEGARRIHGYEPDEIIGQHFSRFYTPEDRTAGEPMRALETVRRDGRFVAEGWRVRKNGERFRASVVMEPIRDEKGHAIGFAKVTRDITEREEAQRQLEKARDALFQSQKMEALGQLTGGVAHDFNNLLMAVLSSLELLRKRLPADATSQRLLQNAVDGAQRGATLTQRMLAFARRQELILHSVDVAQLFSGMNDLVQRSIGPEWPITFDLPQRLPAVRADTNQLEMALLNLIVNARDASPSGGSILVRASVANVDAGSSNGLAPGGFIRLEVSDTGMGMDEETLRRATEPFFTTKGVGKGTGLGLPMVHGMALQLGGAFELVSRPGQGTSAILWLPVAAHEDEPVTPAPAQEPSPLPRTRLTILAVDDDALVLMNTAALLDDLGHEVIEAFSGADALAKFRAREDIDLLITDQAMPNMTGIQLVSAIEEIRPGMPVIIASGYGEGLEVPGRSVERLGKPFDQDRLAQAIAKVMEGGGIFGEPARKQQAVGSAR
jgi:PAS domain S-box-containing protein